jgi:hypothetical protein
MYTTGTNKSKYPHAYSSVNMRFIIVITQFRVTIATNRWELTLRMNLSYVVGYWQNRLLWVYRVYSVSTDVMFMWICEFNILSRIWGVWPQTGHGLTTSNYSSAADLHTLQFNTAPAKHFPAFYALTSRSLATASNSGDSSVSRAEALVTTALAEGLSIPSILGTRLTLLITFRHEPHRKHRFHCYSPTVPR